MEPIDGVIAALQAIATAAESRDTRLATMEAHLADSASSAEEMSKAQQCAAESMKNIANSVAKLTEMVTNLSASFESLQGIVGNYVQETQRLRVDSRNLISEVRQRLG